jgi:dsDNA-binding SOS-regulon protein
MAVESRFVVIRQGVEVETFMDKKAADEYDKMLDMADNLSEMFESAPVDINESIREELSIYLAQNREQVLIALQAKKVKPTPVKKIVKSETAEPNSGEPKTTEPKPSIAKNSELPVTDVEVAETKSVPVVKKVRKAKAAKSKVNDAESTQDIAS